MEIFKILFCFINILLYQPIENANIIGEYQNEHYIVLYGNVDNEDQDGYLVIKDAKTNTVKTYIVYDDNGYESFKYIADVGNNQFIVVCERYYQSNNFELPEFKNILLIKYDFNGNFIDEYVLKSKPIKYYNHHEMLIVEWKEEDFEYINFDLQVESSITLLCEYTDSFSMQYQGNAYVNNRLVDEIKLNYPGNYEIKIEEFGHVFSYDIVIKSEVFIIGDRYNEMFLGDIKIVAKGQLFINSQPYTSGDLIENPGYYNFTLLGENNYEYNELIVILPTIQYSVGEETFDFVDDLEVYETLIIYSDGISMLLNGEVYLQTLIEYPGRYELIVYGVNGMQFNLNFTIYPGIEGVEDNGTYDSVNIEIFGDALLNGELIRGNLEVSYPGNYCIELLLDDQVWQVYNFSILEKDVEIVGENSGFNLNYLFVLITIVGAIFIFRKK